MTRFATVDVFTDTRFAGNPLAGIPDARGLALKQEEELGRLSRLLVRTEGGASFVAGGAVPMLEGTIR